MNFRRGHEILNIAKKISYNILPNENDVFEALDFFPPKDTKIIIIGQDPYPNKDDAMGLAFSIRHNKIPPSLKNIFKELQNDLGYGYPNTGDLTSWAAQGILLLNSILTVEEGQSLSHVNIGWEGYTNELIQKVIDYNKPLVIICWGNYAKEKLKNLRIHDNILVLTGGHPSPLNRTGSFFGKKYFSKANKWLIEHNIKPIDWKL